MAKSNFTGLKARFTNLHLRLFPTALKGIANLFGSALFLTHNFLCSLITITDLYGCRWQVELFFKWIKQNLFRHFATCGQNANMDRCCRPCVDRNCQKRLGITVAVCSASVSFQCFPNSSHNFNLIERFKVFAGMMIGVVETVIFLLDDG